MDSLFLACTLTPEPTPAARPWSILLSICAMLGYFVLAMRPKWTGYTAQVVGRNQVLKSLLFFSRRNQRRAQAVEDVSDLIMRGPRGVDPEEFVTIVPARPV